MQGILAKNIFMTTDNTSNMDRTDRGNFGLQREEQLRQGDFQREFAQEQLALQHGAVQCSHCGAINDADVAFCSVCGQPLRMVSCPNCGSEIDPDADFCESCHHYIRKDVCSFCGAHLMEQEAYCPECGSPRGGLACPVCHTLNDFAFCKQCGTPLTDEARLIVRQLRQQPEYQQVLQLAREYNELQLHLPYTSERDIEREEKNFALRERVLMLLAQDKGVERPVVAEPKDRRMSKEDVDRKKEEVMDKLAELLDNMAIPSQPSAAKVRNYAMAQKPVGVRLAWVCNYKHAMHSSPCGCAKPQLGGKWVILGHNSKHEIKDDK